MPCLVFVSGDFGEVYLVDTDVGVLTAVAVDTGINQFYSMII